MTQQDLEWLEANQLIFGNIRLSKEQHAEMFDIYNRITGENKRTTSCGRCVMSVKKRLKFEYEKQRNKN